MGTRIPCALLLLLLGTVGVASRTLHLQESLLSASAGRRRLAQTTTLDLTAAGPSVFSGTTPLVIGVNVGHRYPGSNWPLWFSRLGVNGARVFLSALWGSSLESFVGSTRWGKSLSGAAVTNLASFQAAVAELRTPSGRANPPPAQLTNPVKWATLESKWATTDTSSQGDEQEGNHNATLSTLSQILANAPLVVIGCGMGAIRDSGVLDNTTAAYWASHWEVYKHFYAFTLFLWKRGITRIELYNEPDLDNDFQNDDGSFKNALWVDQMTLRSRAIQDLFADLNAEDAGPDLLPQINVGAYAKTQYNEGKMGQPAVQALHNTFAQATNPDPAFTAFTHYSYHSYGQSGKTILSNFQELLANVTADRTASGVNLKFAVTEFNAKTSGDFSNSAYNMDTASQAIKLGSQLINYVTAGAELTSIYVFKFSVTLSSSNGVAKNGIHWGDNTGAPYQIGDTTLGAEAVRLAADKLAGARNILALNSAAASTMPDTKAVAVLNDQGSAYHIFVVNTGSAAITASLALSAWGINSAGFPVIVELVNASSYGEVSEQLTTSAAGGVAVALPPDNLVRLTIPATKPALQNITASATAHVRAGANSATNYGSSTIMCVGTARDTTHTNTFASVMKFTVPNPAAITSAVLRLRVSSLSAGLTSNMPMLLLGVSGNDWTAGSVTWNSLVASNMLKQHPPTGSSSTWKVDSIANNFINWGAPGVQVVGHVTLPSGLTTSKAAGTLKMVDVTAFVKKSSGTVSFLLLRPFRNNQEVATGNTIPADTLNAGASACFHSASAAASNQPVLQVF